MNIKLLAMAVGLCGIATQVLANTITPNQYELYSWKRGNDWEFSLVPAEHTSTKAAVEIKHEGGPLRGTSKVKEKLLSMKEGDSISWQQRANSGMVYPPDVVIEDIRDYAQSVGVKLAAPHP